MYNNLFQKGGYYHPTFFHAKIHTDEALDNLANLSDEAKSTFLHEYIHFIQDVTTYYGLMNIHMNVDILKYLNKKILDSSSNIIHLPLQIDHGNSVRANYDLRSYYIGDDLNIPDIQIIDVNTKSDGLIAQFPSLEYYEIKLMDGTGALFDYQLGAAALMESMAFEIEKFYFPDEELSDAPYKIVRKLVEFYDLNLLTTQHIVALCDACLGYPQPGRLLLSILQMVKSGKVKINSPVDIYRTVFNFSFSHPDEGIERSYRSVFERQLVRSREQLKNLFTLDRFDPIKEWIDDVFCNSFKIRRNNFAIPLQLLNTCNVNEFINYYLNHIGCPMLSNDRHKFWFHNKRHRHNEQIPSLMVIRDILSLLDNGDPVCGLNKFCKKNYPQDITDDNCFKSPWKRAEYKELCYFGRVFKMWGLGQKEYVLT